MVWIKIINVNCFFLTLYSLGIQKVQPLPEGISCTLGFKTLSKHIPVKNWFD